MSNSLIAQHLKGLFSITLKKRHDNITDQYYRIFMVKFLLGCAVVLGVSWYSDNLNCVLPEEEDENYYHNDDSSGGRLSTFISPSCWIQGLYIYEELRTRFDVVAYYGLPKDLDEDGMVQGYLCRTENKFLQVNKMCKPMQRIYYLQYQWMPFYVCVMALMYYVPYVFFNAVNRDIFTLKKDLKKEDATAEQIIRGYFTEHCKYRKKGRYTVRQTLNIAIKLFYLGVNAVALIGTDVLFENKFLAYGIQWIKWSKHPNTLRFDYKGLRDFPKPGNELFPPFGFCDIYSSSSDRKTTFTDKHSVLCELSQHILFQYVFMVIWFAIAIGICASSLGVILQIGQYVIGIGIRHRAFKTLTFRQREYLDYIYMKNRPMYKEIIEKLREKFHEKVNDSNITLATAPLISDKALDDLDVRNVLRHRLSDCNEC